MIMIYTVAAVFAVLLLCVASLMIATGLVAAFGHGLLDGIRWVLGRLP